MSYSSVSEKDGRRIGFFTDGVVKVNFSADFADNINRVGRNSFTIGGEGSDLGRSIILPGFVLEG